MIATQEIACNVCSGKRHKVAHGQALDRLHGITGRFDYVECLDCGLVYMNPQVAVESIPALYPADYSPHQKPKPAGTPKTKLPTSRQTGIARSFDLFFKNEKIPPHCLPNSGGRILDIGCGSGAFLDQVRQQYPCEVFGVDLSEAAVATAKTQFDLEVFHGTLLDARFPDGHFDVVTAWWYLEHVPDPLPVLQEVARILKPGGRCILGVPNTHSVVARLFAKNWYHLDSPRHLCLYNPKAMRFLLQQAGLSDPEFSTDKSPWGLIGSLAYLLGGNGETARKMRRLFWLRQVLLPVTALIGLLGWGDTLVVRSKKIP